MCRGNNGQDIFVSDAGFRTFLSTLKEACERTGWIVHAYVLMPNHYHLLFETPEANLVSGMKWFQGTYTQRFHSLFNRNGHLFQGRYKALPVETSNQGYFREVGQYIHLNPFRAGLAGAGKKIALDEYLWSSYPFYSGENRNVSEPEWLERTRLYSACGLDSRMSRCAALYRGLIELRMRGGSDVSSGSEHELVEKQLQRGWYVGSPSFGRKLAGQIGETTDNLRGMQRRAHGEQEAERLLTAACRALGLKERELLAMKSTCREKQAAAWLLMRKTVVTGVWVAGRLRMGHRVNASRAVSVFEQQSDQTVRRLKEKMLQCTG